MNSTIYTQHNHNANNIVISGGSMLGSGSTLVTSSQYVYPINKRKNGYKKDKFKCEIDQRGVKKVTDINGKIKMLNGIGELLDGINRGETVTLTITKQT